MATVLKECITEEHRSVMRFFCGQKVLLQRIITNKCFLFTVRSVCRRKRFTIWSRNSLKDVRKSLMMTDQVRKCLRQQLRRFYGAGFDALVKRWDKCINVDGGYVEKYNFVQIRISHILRFISSCVPRNICHTQQGIQYTYCLVFWTSQAGTVSIIVAHNMCLVLKLGIAYSV
jgi:hypothetical protein